MEFSVLMSVYKNDRPEYLAECLESIFRQTLRPTEVILVEDGEITRQLGDVIEEFSDLIPIRRIKLVENKGLAEALNVGLKHCVHEIVIRMDADDVSLPARFARQIEFMHLNRDVDVASSWLEERDKSMKKITFLKKLPVCHDELLKFAKRRSPINHPAAVFKRSAVLAVGGYPLIFPEDYALWSLMLTKGYKFSNIPEVLLQMRTGDDFIARRGWRFFMGEVGLLRYQKSIGFLSRREFILNFLMRAAVRLPSPYFRKAFYKYAR